LLRNSRIGRNAFQVSNLVETVGYKEMAEVHGNRTHPPASSSPAHWFYSYKPSRKIHI
jgi:hypothetical protein